MSRFKAIGVMSGTSCDAIDVALIETDGLAYVKSLKFGSFPIEMSLKSRLFAAMKDHSLITPALELEVTEAHVAAVAGFEGDIYGFHGQTLWHKPEIGKTCQVFDGAFAHHLLKKPVVCDFRSLDMAHGGEGAPLVPIYHQALVESVPCAFLNLGGVANITYIDSDQLIACDTGPASALIDDFMRERTGQDYDEDGATAAKGRPNVALLQAALAHDYFSRPMPKSLDRNGFKFDLSGLSVEDGAATLTAFTVLSVKKAVAILPRLPLEVHVCGGGAKNKFMMMCLNQALGVPVRPFLRAESIEAECFAYLAVRSSLGLPISFPTTTGVNKPLTGGVLYSTL